MHDLTVATVTGAFRRPGHELSRQLTTKKLSGNRNSGCNFPEASHYSEPFRQMEPAVLVRRSKIWTRPGTS